MGVTEKSWSIHGVTFSLELWPGQVFIPVTVSEVLSQHVGAGCKDAVVIDMGCGSGFFAVLAAKLGAAKVYGVDVTPQAVELTKKNLLRNGIRGGAAEVFCGSLFEPLKGIEADQIILDVSGIAGRLARSTPWYPEGIATASDDGTEPTISALTQARAHLLPGGRLLFPCLSLAHETRIHAVAKEMFGPSLRLLSEKLIPVTQPLRTALDQCPDLEEKGWVSVIERRRKKYWLIRVYEARRDA